VSVKLRALLKRLLVGGAAGSPWAAHFENRLLIDRGSRQTGSNLYCPTDRRHPAERNDNSPLERFLTAVRLPIISGRS